MGRRDVVALALGSRHYSGRGGGFVESDWERNASRTVRESRSTDRTKATRRQNEMMNRKPLLMTVFFSIVVIAASAFAPGDDSPSAPKPTGDLGKFQGKWTTKIGPRQGLEAVVTIKGNDVEMKIVTPDGVGFELTGEIKIDEKAKPYRTLNWTKFKTPMGDDIPENLGIYKFEDDDTVHICTGGPSNERPTEFKAEEGGAQLGTMKRVVEKEKEKGEPKPKGAEPEKAK
jgi:uncharacterized protein (TIGR03067 family)